MQVAILCLISCTTTNYNSLCPAYPIAGPKVAQELTNAPIQQYPNTWEWIGRIDKLRQELELCR